MHVHNFWAAMTAYTAFAGQVLILILAAPYGSDATFHLSAYLFMISGLATIIVAVNARSQERCVTLYVGLLASIAGAATVFAKAQSADSRTGTLVMSMLLLGLAIRLAWESLEVQTAPRVHVAHATVAP